MAERDRRVLVKGRRNNLSSKRIAKSRKHKRSYRMIEQGKGSYWSGGDKNNEEEI